MKSGEYRAEKMLKILFLSRALAHVSCNSSLLARFRSKTFPARIEFEVKKEKKRYYSLSKSKASVRLSDNVIDALRVVTQRTCGRWNTDDRAGSDSHTAATLQMFLQDCAAILV